MECYFGKQACNLQSMKFQNELHLLSVGIQTATLWIYYVHPARKERASNHLNFIHNNNHRVLNIQDCNRSLQLNKFEESLRVSSHSILITLVKSNN